MMKIFHLYIDESGEHGLVNINMGFPVFVLCGLLMSEINYVIIRDEINALKNDIWGDKKVILHSRDIRKCEKEFTLLFDLGIKHQFYEAINKIFRNNDYNIISSAINKIRYVEKHGKLGNDVYEISLAFVIEKAVEILIESMGNDFGLKIYIEKRGKKEDQQLSEHLQKIRIRGSAKVPSDKYIEHIKEIKFIDKKENINGLQLADLAAYPIARYVIDSERANPAYEILKEKIYHKERFLEGLIIYP